MGLSHGVGLELGRAVISGIKPDWSPGVSLGEDLIGSPGASLGVVWVEKAQ